ncbi:proteasome regulatory particle base subunit [Podila clonocystis]|nr:proteasome regulatory particle base subunit [Podila clonocystis]
MRFIHSQALVVIVASFLVAGQVAAFSSPEEAADFEAFAAQSEFADYGTIPVMEEDGPQQTHFESWSENDVPIVPQNIKITNLLRTLDLSRPLIREITSAAIQNIAEEDVNDYYFPVDQTYMSNLAHITAENRKTKETLELVKDEQYLDGQFQYYRIKLSSPLTPGQKMQITIKSSLSNIIRPFPTHVGQAEKQKVVYFGNPFALTAYPATKQKTTVITPSNVLDVLHSPEEVDVVIKNNQVILGPYNDVNALEHGIFEIQYQLTGAIQHVRHLRRDVEVSHWGNNLAVEEHYSFVNNGAQLKGQFSRIDYQRNPMAIRDGNGILGFVTQIPKLASEIYYRDEIGNISTSAIVHQSDHVQLHMKPRFPLFGGWNTTWYIGYNAPLDGYVHNVPKSDKYILKVPVFAPMKDTTYEQVEIRVVLPEGSQNVKVHLPFEVESIEQSTTKTYMDSAGRSTVTIQARNLIEDHAQDMLIEYEYSSISYLTKPLAAATMLMAVFATSMIVSRLDFKIGGSAIKKNK